MAIRTMAFACFQNSFKLNIFPGYIKGDGNPDDYYVLYERS